MGLEPDPISFGRLADGHEVGAQKHRRHAFELEEAQRELEGRRWIQYIAGSKRKRVKGDTGQYDKAPCNQNSN